MELSKGYPIHIRYNDLDTYGHVNNAVYLTYLEEGRTRWFKERVGENWDWRKNGMLLAKHEINYKIPILLNEDARIFLWITNLGNKSFQVSFKITKPIRGKWTTCTYGSSIAVCIDYSTQKSIEIPEEWRVLFQKDLEENKDEPES